MKLLKNTGEGKRQGGTVRARWNDAVLAESDRTVVVEGNHYFPAEDVNWELLEPSDQLSICPWKGEADYHTAVVDGERNEAWSYANPKHAAAELKDHLAFWQGVRVEEA